ncbi:hypothetical protein MRB53_006022 [Persea americana]|uniref:Uncharacterized protein n=1 Tax=Persea americana TaxID=3435 RepID=A0ACC2MF00_PERAE|nr:hypothetical protein MRB53_006022 [Persea americana]
MEGGSKKCRRRTDGKWPSGFSSSPSCPGGSIDTNLMPPCSASRLLSLRHYSGGSIPCCLLEYKMSLYELCISTCCGRKEMEGYNTRNSHFAIATTACLRIRWWQLEYTFLHPAIASEDEETISSDKTRPLHPDP